jgi:hypothetical protein
MLPEIAVSYPPINDENINPTQKRTTFGYLRISFHNPVFCSGSFWLGCMLRGLIGKLGSTGLLMLTAPDEYMRVRCMAAGGSEGRLVMKAKANKTSRRQKACRASGRGTARTRGYTWFGRGSKIPARAMVGTGDVAGESHRHGAQSLPNPNQRISPCVSRHLNSTDLGEFRATGLIVIADCVSRT